MFYQVTLLTGSNLTVSANSYEQAAKEVGFGKDTMTEIKLPLAGWELAKTMVVGKKTVTRYTHTDAPGVCKTFINGTFAEHQLTADFL